MIRISRPSIGDEERRAVLAVLESGRLANGPVVPQFEEAFAREVSHTREAVAASSGTAALHMALLAHGIGPEDEVITSAFSFQAATNMVLATGARPVFVDVKEDGNIDPAQVEAAITPQTKALLPVHLYGRICDMPVLCAIASDHGLAVIEDAAQAHGATMDARRAGAFGTGCFSLYATKNLAAGEGGVITTDDPELADRLRLLRSHGELERYNSAELGYNFRMPELSAAMAMAQVPHLHEMTEKRRRNAQELSGGLKGVNLPRQPRAPEEHVWHQYTVRVPEGRDALRNHLRSEGIEAGIYYPRTIPGQELYWRLGYDENSYPVARQLAQEVLSLPVHPGLSEADLTRVIEVVNAWAGSTGR